MEDKITIIEGPPPTFEESSEFWTESLTDGLLVSQIVYTKLRTFNGKQLVERCKNAWQDGDAIYLEYKTFEGLEKRSPIVAARDVRTDEGDVLLLWLRIVNDDVVLEFGYEDELDIDSNSLDDNDDDVDDDFNMDDFDFPNLLN